MSVKYFSRQTSIFNIFIDNIILMTFQNITRSSKKKNLDQKQIAVPRTVHSIGSSFIFPL